MIQTGDGEKGRSFRATLLAYVRAFEFGTDNIRPAYMTLATSAAEAAPFLANLRKGRKAEVANGGKGDRFELLKSAGYAFALQKHPEGTAITAYLPGLFALDPGMVDPTGVRFVVLPSRQWAAAHPVDAKAVAHARRACPDVEGDFAALAPTATLFAAYLDRRTRCPLIADQGFYLQILVAALTQGLASLSTRDRYGGRDRPWGQHGFLEEHDTEAVGLLPGVACRATHGALEAFLAEQVGIYYGAKRGRKAA